MPARLAPGLCTGSTKDGLSMALCIPMLLYNEDCPPCHLSSHEYYAVCGRERELSIEDNDPICFSISIKNHEKKITKIVILLNDKSRLCLVLPFPWSVGAIEREKRRKKKMWILWLHWIPMCIANKPVICSLRWMCYHQETGSRELGVGQRDDWREGSSCRGKEKLSEENTHHVLVSLVSCACWELSGAISESVWFFFF